jgi:hypothetical protein
MVIDAVASPKSNRYLPFKFARPNVTESGAAPEFGVAES